jgi:phosphatidylserine/phosphatidylglycerophosphate/cardiolipin synthase-like enzyme
MLEVFFSGTTDINSLIQGLIQSSQKSIHFAMFALTNKDFIDLLKNVSKNNVVVKGIVDQEQIYNSREILFDLMNFKHMHIKAIGSRDARMHHKFIIIDENITITGSFNWTYQANTKNKENIVLIIDKDISSKFIEEFKRLENQIDGIVEVNTSYKFDDADISNLIFNMKNDESSKLCKNTVIYYDENGKIHVTTVDPKDVVTYADERGFPSKKYLRVML